jgi:hypothetical protein
LQETKAYFPHSMGQFNTRKGDAGSKINGTLIYAPGAPGDMHVCVCAVSIPSQGTAPIMAMTRSFWKVTRRRRGSKVRIHVIVVHGLMIAFVGL